MSRCHGVQRLFNSSFQYCFEQMIGDCKYACDPGSLRLLVPTYLHPHDGASWHSCFCLEHCAEYAKTHGIKCVYSLNVITSHPARESTHRVVEELEMGSTSNPERWYWYCLGALLVLLIAGIMAAFFMRRRYRIPRRPQGKCGQIIRRLLCLPFVHGTTATQPDDARGAEDPLLLEVIPAATADDRPPPADLKDTLPPSAAAVSTDALPPDTTRTPLPPAAAAENPPPLREITDPPSPSAPPPGPTPAEPDGPPTAPDSPAADRHVRMTSYPILGPPLASGCSRDPPDVDLQAFKPREEEEAENLSINLNLGAGGEGHPRLEHPQQGPSCCPTTTARACSMGSAT